MENKIARVLTSFFISAGFVYALQQEVLGIEPIHLQAETLEQCPLFNRSKQGIAEAYGYSGWKEFHDRLSAYDLYDVVENKGQALDNTQIDTIIKSCGCPGVDKIFLTKSELLTKLNISPAKFNNPRDSLSKVFYKVVYQRRKNGKFTYLYRVSPIEIAEFIATIDYFHISRWEVFPNEFH